MRKVTNKAENERITIPTTRKEKRKGKRTAKKEKECTERRASGASSAQMYRLTAEQRKKNASAKS